MYGDLDWITMKALEKDRTRRYSAAASLAEDIARHLNPEPVLASPPNVTYRMGKFLRKYRGPVAAAAAVVVILVVGLAGTLVMYSRALQAEKDATRSGGWLKHAACTLQARLVGIEWNADHTRYQHAPIDKRSTRPAGHRFAVSGSGHAAGR